MRYVTNRSSSLAESIQPVVHNIKERGALQIRKLVFDITLSHLLESFDNQVIYHKDGKALTVWVSFSVESGIYQIYFDAFSEGRLVSQHLLQITEEPEMDLLTDSLSLGENGRQSLLGVADIHHILEQVGRGQIEG